MFTLLGWAFIVGGAFHLIKLEHNNDYIIAALFLAAAIAMFGINFSN